LPPSEEESLAKQTHLLTTYPYESPNRIRQTKIHTQ